MDLYQLLPTLLPYILVVAGGVMLYLGLLGATYSKLLFAERLAAEIEEEEEIREMAEKVSQALPPPAKK